MDISLLVYIYIYVIYTGILALQIRPMTDKQLQDYKQIITGTCTNVF